MKKILYTIALIGTLMLTGCANAGKDQSVVASTLVTLDASASTPSKQGEIKHYSWKQIRGKHVVLSGQNSIQATFTAPAVTHTTRLFFRLKTIEEGGRVSPFKTYDVVAIIVHPQSNPNHAPHAVATVSSSTVEEGESVTFDASGSSDSDGDGEIASYKWLNAAGETLSNASHFTHVFTESGEYTITLEVMDDDGEVGRTSVTVTVNTPTDTTAPVITLNGESNVTLTVGDAYIDAGATAVDDRDGNVSVTTAGSVDTNTVGIYTITYTATDAAGNSATASRTVTVTEAADNTKPTITLLGQNPVTLTVGDRYTDAGATANDDRDGNITANIQTTSNVDTTVAGTYTVTYNVSDAAGNVADTVTRTVVVEDNTPVPVIDDNFTIDVTKIDGYNVNDPIEDQYLAVINYLRGLRIKCDDPDALEGPVGVDLAWNTLLADAAQEHSNDMQATGIFAHDGSGTATDITGQTFNPTRNSTPFERMRYHGYNYHTAGENIAFRASSPTLPTDAWVSAFEGLMKSHTGHCSNIMNPDFKDFGMAETKGEYDFGNVIGEAGYWTQNFGAQ